jgi:hypothetical protein
MNQPNALQRMILDRKAEKDWTYDDISKRGGLPKATVYKLATKDLDGLPRAKTLSALAKGLGLPARVVREAAIKAATMTTYSEDMSEWEQVIVGHSRELTDEQRRQVMTLVEAMLGE